MLIMEIHFCRVASPLDREGSPPRRLFSRSGRLSSPSALLSIGKDTAEDRKDARPSISPLSPSALPVGARPKQKVNRCGSRRFRLQPSAVALPRSEKDLIAFDDLGVPVEHLYFRLEECALIPRCGEDFVLFDEPL